MEDENKEIESNKENVGNVDSEVTATEIDTTAEVKNTDTIVDETVSNKEPVTDAEPKTDKESYFGYYIFVIISAIIGFFTLYAFSRLSIKVLAEKGLLEYGTKGGLIATITSVVGVVLFIFFALLFKKIFKKIFLSELFMYAYIGFLTTAINILAFNKLVDVFAKNNTSESLGWKIAEALAFIIAIVFAFIANKIFVFKSMDFSIKKFGNEFVGFIGTRLFTELLNVIIMWVMIDKCSRDETFSKVIASIVVIILNYVFGKFFVFRKNVDE